MIFNLDSVFHDDFLNVKSSPDFQNIHQLDFALSLIWLISPSILPPTFNAILIHLLLVFWQRSKGIFVPLFSEFSLQREVNADRIGEMQTFFMSFLPLKCSTDWKA